jgi:drug/metabolite transporter (DMT)-like permease
MNSFQSYSILAFIGIFFLGLRDLITRNVKSDISSLSISIYAFLATTIGGVLLIPISNSFVVLSSLHLYLILLSAFIASFSYFMLVLATRKGDVSVISPFRYTRLLFALILAVFILGERPDIYTLVGATIIILSGCYTFWREYLIKKNKIYK